MKHALANLTLADLQARIASPHINVRQREAALDEIAKRPIKHLTRAVDCNNLIKSSTSD